MKQILATLALAFPGSLHAQCTEEVHTPGGPTAGATSFGRNVALDGSWAAVTYAGTGGGLLLFERIGDAWVPSPPIPLGSSGTDFPVSLRSDLVVARMSTFVRAYRLAPGGWQPEAVWGSPPGASGSLATDGNTIVIGGSSTQVVEHNGSSWNPPISIDDPTPGAGSTFGSAVDVEGDTLAISDNETGGSAVHVYHRGPGGWELADTLNADSGVGSIALDGDRLFIGLPFAGGPAGPFGVGEVRIAERSGDQWTLRGAVSGPVALGLFGQSIDARDDRVAVGASGASARVYLLDYDAVTDAWEVGQAFDDYPVGANRFGISVAVSQEDLWVGSDQPAPFPPSVYPGGAAFSFGPAPCPIHVQNSPIALEACNSSASNSIVSLEGEALYKVSSVQQTSGAPMTFSWSITADARIELDVELPTAFGSVELLLSGADSSSSAVIEVTAGAPFLELGTTAITSGTRIDLTACGEPGQFFALLGAISNLPSTLPGVIDLGLGNQFSFLVSLETWSAPVDGLHLPNVVLQGTGSPQLIPVHLQAVDLTSSLPYTVSNVVSGNWLF